HFEAGPLSEGLGCAMGEWPESPFTLGMTRIGRPGLSRALRRLPPDVVVTVQRHAIRRDVIAAGDGRARPSTPPGGDRLRGAQPVDAALGLLLERALLTSWLLERMRRRIRRLRQPDAGRRIVDLVSERTSAR